MNKTYAELALERDELQSENEELRFIMDKMLARGNQLIEENEELKKQLENAVELPCKLGTTVWFVSIVLECKDDRGFVDHFEFDYRHIPKFDNEIGLNWFLTREKAEARLKELSDE